MDQAFSSRPFHIHLVSDSTGETVSTVARAAVAYFRDIETVEHTAILVRTRSQMNRVLKQIDQYRGIALYTLADEELRTVFETECRRLRVPTLAILDPVVATLSTILGVEPAASRPGAQHRIDREYFQRIQAMEFALTHDDGQLAAQAEDADVVLVGVSRTSKTPTAMYLANRGIRVANIPVVPGIELPRWIEEGTGSALIVALTTSPDRLSVLRRARLSSIGVGADADYSDRVRIRDEVVDANRMYARMGWPTIDVTGRSIEETSASVLELMRKRQDSK